MCHKIKTYLDVTHEAQNNLMFLINKKEKTHVIKNHLSYSLKNQ